MTSAAQSQSDADIDILAGYLAGLGAPKFQVETARSLEFDWDMAKAGADRDFNQSVTRSPIRAVRAKSPV